MTSIPYDVYESDAEIVVVVPLWGVSPETIWVVLDKNKLLISWERKRPQLKENLVPQKEDCYWWKFELQVQLPLTVKYEEIQPVLTKENILLITVPKYQLPDQMKLEVKMMS